MAGGRFSLRSLLGRTLILGAMLGVALIGSSIAHAAPQSSVSTARALGTGCEPNGLPGSVAVCDGTGRLNVRLSGTAVLSVRDGRVTLKGRAERVCKLKRFKRKNGKRVVRRVCKRAKPIVPRNVVTRKSRGYTIYIGRWLYFYLPAGTWRISVEGAGVSLSAVGEGRAGVVSRIRRNDTRTTPGLISVGGQIYNRWPKRWTKYEFGPDVENDEDRPMEPRRSGRTSSSESSLTGSGAFT